MRSWRGAALQNEVYGKDDSKAKGGTCLGSPLLELDLDEQEKADEGYRHEEGQENTHVEELSWLLWRGEPA